MNVLYVGCPFINNLKEAVFRECCVLLDTWEGCGYSHSLKDGRDGYRKCLQLFVYSCFIHLSPPFNVSENRRQYSDEKIRHIPGTILEYYSDKYFYFLDESKTMNYPYTMLENIPMKIILQDNRLIIFTENVIIEIVCVCFNWEKKNGYEILN